MAYVSPFGELDKELDTRVSEQQEIVEEATPKWTSPFTELDEVAPETPEQTAITKEKRIAINGMAESVASQIHKGSRFGWYEGSKSLYNWAANIPGGLADLASWLAYKTGSEELLDYKEKVGENPWEREDRDSILRTLEGTLRLMGEKASPEEWAAQNMPSGIPGKVAAGAASAPAEIAKLYGPIKLLGTTGGFSAASMIGALDQPNEVIIEEGVKGALAGKMFKALEPLAMWSKVAAGASLGGGMAAAEGGDVEDVVSGAITLGGLMALGGGARKPGAAYRPPVVEISPLKNPNEAYTPISDGIKADLLSKYAQNLQQLQEVRAAQKKSKPGDIRETLKVAGRDLKIRNKDLMSKIEEFNTAKKLEQNLQYTLAYVQRVANERGTDPRYELSKVFPKLAPEYKVPDLPKLAAELRADSKNPGAIILDPSTLKSRLIKEITTGVNDKGDPIVKPVAIESDIPSLTKYATGSIVPPKFMEQNTLLRWAVDTLYEHRIATENGVQELLYSPRMAKGLGLSSLRQAKQVPTKAGGLTVWDTLSRNKQRKVLDALIADEFAARDGKVDTSSKTLESKYGLEGSQIEAYRALRTMNERTLDIINDTIAKFRPELKQIERLPNWLPHTFLGDFKVFAKDANGNLVFAGGTATKIGQATLAKKLSKQFPDLEILSPVPSSVKGRGGDISSKVFAETMMFLGKDHPLTPAVAEAYQQSLAEMGFLKHRKSRQWVEGWSGTKEGTRGVKDFEYASKLFIQGAVEWAQRQKTDSLMNPIITDGVVNSKYPNSMDYVRRVKNNAFGQKSVVSDLISNVTKDMVGEHGVSKLFGGINRATLISKLYRFAFFPSQAWQPFESVTPKLMDLNAKGISGDIGYAHARAMMDFFVPSKGAADATRFAVSTKTLAPKFVTEATHGDIFTKGEKTITGRSIGKTIFEVGSLEHPVSVIESGSRHYANLVFYNYLISAKVPHAEAVRTAARLTDRTMVEYNNFERPLLFTEGGLGTAGKPLGLFQTFKFNRFAQYIEYAKTAKNTKDYKPLVTLLGMNMVVAGLGGVLGAAEYDLLASVANEQLGTKLPSIDELMIKHNVSDWFMFGAPSTTLGMDVSSTMNAPGVASEPFFRAPGLEYIGESLLTGSELLVKEARGTATDDDRMGFWKALAPTQYQGAVEMYYTNKKFGKILNVPIPDPKNKGRGTVWRDIKGWYFRMLGARSLEESRQLKAFYQMTRLDREAVKSEETLVSLVAHSIVNGDPSPDWAYNELGKMGVTGEQLTDKIKARIVLWNTTLLERTKMDKGLKQQMRRGDILEGLEESGGE